jgi:two-component system sensor histidine kinase VicK
MKFEAAPGVNQQGLDDIIKETDRLTYLVSQMLTLARVDSDGAEIKQERVDLGGVVRDIGRQMSLLGNEKGVAVSVDSGSAEVVGDEQRLGELAIILLDNAIKYTDSGGRVAAKVTNGGGKVRLEVEDTGRGIPPESLERVFDRFYRVDKGRSREAGGTGLGLAIAKWIVDSHGGTIGIASEPGRGTTVTVEMEEVVSEEPGARSKELESDRGVVPSS